MQLKNKVVNKEIVIAELRQILEDEDYSITYLEKYLDDYNNSNKNYSKLCHKCTEWEKLDLPNDCLCKPDYCIKDKQDFWVIKLYEDLKMYIEKKE